MSTSPEPNDHWDACPAGQLRQLAADLAADDRGHDRNLLIGRVLTASLLCVLVGGITFWSTRPRPLEGLSCVECRSHFAAYHYQLVFGGEMLPSRLFRQVEYHLDQCGSCRTRFSDLYPEAIAWISPGSWLAANPTIVQAHAVVLLAVAGL